VLVITEKQYTHLDILLGEPTPYDAPQQDKDLMVCKRKTSPRLELRVRA